MLQDPPILTIRREFPRPDPALVAKLAGAQTGHVIDAMNGRGAMHAAIKPVDTARAAFVGVAITAASGADDNLAIIAGLAFAKPGDVLIAAGDAFTATAVVGDNVAIMATNAGVRAIVIDGMARDLAGLLDVGLPVHARGITPNSCVKSGPGKVNVPVVAGGVAVTPGDVVIGDRDGVVVIPQSQLAAVVARLDEIRRLEAEVQRKLRDDKLTHTDAVRALLASDKVVYLD